MASILPEAPRIATNFDPFTGYTLTGSSVVVANGASIATGISTAIAQSKQIVELTAGGTYTEAVVLPVHPFDWMMLRTQGTTLVKGQRVTPALAASQNFAKLQVPNNAYGLIPAVGGGRWIYESFEVLPADGTFADTHSLVMLVNDVDAMSGSLRDIPYKMAARHLYVHGVGTDGFGTNNRRAGITPGANECEITDCWVAQINFAGMAYAGQAQSMNPISGIGKLRVENCFLWGSSEPIAFGGAAQTIPCKSDQITYADIIFRGNHVYRTPRITGIQASENGLEMKIGRRARIENNIFENGWPSTQTGRAFVLWSAEAEEPATAYAQTCDILIQNNWIKNYAMCAQLTSQYHPSNCTLARRIRIVNNLWTGMGSTIATGNGNPNYSARLFDLDNDLVDCSIENNTFINTGGYLIVTTGTNSVNGSFTRLDFRKNVIGQTAFTGNTFQNPGTSFAGGWAAANANGTNRWELNIILVPGGAGVDVSLPNGGANDTVVSSLADLQLVDSSFLMSQTTKYADLANCDFAPGSPFHGQGKGCDIPTLITKLAGVESPADQLALYN